MVFSAGTVKIVSLFYASGALSSFGRLDMYFIVCFEHKYMFSHGVLAVSCLVVLCSLLFLWGFLKQTYCNTIFQSAKVQFTSALQYWILVKCKLKNCIEVIMLKTCYHFLTTTTTPYSTTLLFLYCTFNSWIDYKMCTFIFYESLNFSVS